MAEGRIPIAAGVITTTTRDASQQAKEAEKSGADALLAITPFYIKPSPEGLYNHFYTLHEATSLPIILYNNPGRTGIDLDLNTLEKLMQLPRLMALKEASPHFTRILSWRRHLRSDFSFMAGDDESAPAFLALGGDGIISVTANIAPKLCTELYNAWINADLGTFASIRDRLAPLHRALFMEPNPCPTKYALSVMGIIRDEVRLPLLPVTEPGQFILRRVLQEGLGLDV
jgi:4-hydroxy-tetrahydrodipicolinate synthase